MKELISQKFKYTDEVLASGAIVNADEVVIRNEQFISGRGTIRVNENITFSFNAYEDIRNNTLTININNAPLDIDAIAYIREFVASVA